MRLKSRELLGTSSEALLMDWRTTLPWPTWAHHDHHARPPSAGVDPRRLAALRKRRGRSRRSAAASRRRPHLIAGRAEPLGRRPDRAGLAVRHAFARMGGRGFRDLPAWMVPPRR